ncbi:HD domain-containing phosphohydrolase [Pseudactinotalea sp. HY158]|uniref:HD domain-containing phosphohydrolase n=1 Tax=Pseudactinotalea sp. HY158 TaxID=2654547 RepID=UPI00129CD88A|nr:HD domain-containing phosphohydrolase [Pseudactinotalea sp. HY158]QGH69772.1 HD domain-containing protein [Pseudactinotalea sp. HY158]
MAASTHESRTRPRRAELLAATSLAIDLGLGQPMEHMLRACVLGSGLAERLGLPTEQRDRIFYASLLAWIGCHADSPELSALFGDDIAFRAGTYAVDKHGLPLVRFSLHFLAAGAGAGTRAVRSARFLAMGGRPLRDLIRSHCVSAGALARRMGIDEVVARQLGYVFERWDGAGAPDGARGEEIPLEMRIVHLADTAEVHLREGGTAAAIRMVRDRRGTQFDPGLADEFCAYLAAPPAGEFAGELMDDAWSAALACAPQDRVVTGAELDESLRAMADFADLKSAYTAGHSRAVARLAGAAARVAGMAEGDRSALHRAGLVHDLGRLGVSNAVWDKAAPLTPVERERVQLHPYLTERILTRVPALAGLGRLAGAHHERLDGSGYPRGTGGEGTGMPARILAAADCYEGWLEPRPHRPAMPRSEAASRLRGCVADLRLDTAAVESVLSADGRPARRRGTWPAGLTAREVEVLHLIVHGRSTREIAAELVISPKTARHHVEHIYLKLGVSNRVGAALFAMEHGIAGAPGTPTGH